MADRPVRGDWPIERIPDEDNLFMRVHRVWMRNGEVIPGVFQDRDGGMSTDWSKYSTPVETQHRAKEPAANGIISLGVGNVRALGQIVEHTPKPTNRAHTDVIGEKSVEVRLKLSRELIWKIDPPATATASNASSPSEPKR